jgi:tetratricopeptide (TPR) repeat protein
MANTKAAIATAAAMCAVVGVLGGMGMAQGPATAPAPATATTSPAVMLEKGIYTEETIGDLDAAMKIYRQIVEDAKAARKYAAQAQYRLGMCYLKKGDKAKATAELRELLATYPQEKGIAAQAQKELAKLAPPVVGDAPCLVKTMPAAFADDVDPSLDKITVTFDRPMMDKSWSWTGGGETFPERVGEISYDADRTTCTMPVKLQPGKVYWVGVNSPSHKNFKSADGIPVARSVILFATKSADGKSTPLPEDMVKQAWQINAASQPATRPIDADRKTAENLSADGWALWNQRKLPEAEAKFQAAVAKDPGNANAWNGLGWAQQNQGKAMNAKDAFEKAVAADPKLAGALNGLGWVAKGQGKIEDAVEYWKKAIAAEPSATAALNGLATTYSELGQYDKSIEAYQQWLKAEPNNKDAKAALKKAQEAAEAVKAAVPAAEQWAKLLDDGKYGDGWDAAAEFFRKAVARDACEKQLASARSPLGRLHSRKVKSSICMTSLPGAPDGQYVVIQFEASFENKKQAVETVTPMKDKDGKWRVSGYYIK